MAAFIWSRVLPALAWSWLGRVLRATLELMPSKTSSVPRFLNETIKVAEFLSVMFMVNGKYNATLAL